MRSHVQNFGLSNRAWLYYLSYSQNSEYCYWAKCCSYVAKGHYGFCLIFLYHFWCRWCNSRHFPDDVFRCIFLNENICISIKISLKFVPKGPINNILVLVQIMAWRRLGVKPSYEPMMVRLPTHICVTRPQWVSISWVRPCSIHLRVLSEDLNFLQDWLWISPWIKSTLNELDITFHILTSQLSGHVIALCICDVISSRL